MSQTAEQGGRLSEREEKLLSRLLADPLAYPQPLKTWIVSYLEGSEIVLPMQSVNGLLEELSDLKKALKALTKTRVAGGVALATADASGQAVTSHGVTLAAGEQIVSIVVTNRRAGKAQHLFSVPTWTATTFTVAGWDTVTNAALLLNEPMQIAWQALITSP